MSNYGTKTFKHLAEIPIESVEIEGKKRKAGAISQ